MHPIEQAVREAATICPHPCKLTFDLLTLKVVFESGVTWGTSVPILVFLGLSVLDLGPMYATDTDVRRALLLNAPYPRGGGIITFFTHKVTSVCVTHTKFHMTPCPVCIFFNLKTPVKNFGSCIASCLTMMPINKANVVKRRFEFLLRYSEVEALKG